MTARRAVFHFAVSALTLAACVETKADPGYCAKCKPDSGMRSDSQVAQDGSMFRLDGATADAASVPDGHVGTLDGSTVDAAADSGNVQDAGRDAEPPVPCAGGCPSSKPVCNSLNDTCVECTPAESTCSGRKSVCDPYDFTCVQCTAAEGAKCGGSTPACDSTARKCVQCTAKDHTACGTDKPLCDIYTHSCVQCTTGHTGACKGATPLCDTQAEACVECLTEADCTDPTKSHCNNDGACVPCIADGQCTHLTDTPVCDEGNGACRECTGDTEVARCGTKSCKRSTGECTDTDRGSVFLCNACAADSECKPGKKCVEQVFGTSPSVAVGTFCFQDKAISPCADDANEAARPYSKEVTKASVDGAEATYCLPVTTCQAFKDASTEKTCATNEDCGVQNVQDGYCTAAKACTYSCIQSVDCPSVVAATCSGMPGLCQ